MINEFLLPVDPELYNFRFSQLQQVTVRYVTFRTQDGNVHVSIDDLTLAPQLLRELTNPLEFIRHCEAAARNNAHSYWQEYDLKLLKPAI